MDVDTQEDALENHVNNLEEPAAVSRLWRSQYLLNSMVSNNFKSYRPFHELVYLGPR